MGFLSATIASKKGQPCAEHTAAMEITECLWLSANAFVYIYIYTHIDMHI